MKQLIITCLALASAVTEVSAQTPSICGSVVSSGSMEPGVYQIPTSASGQFKLLGATEKASGGGVMCDDVYYVNELDNSHSYYGTAKTQAYDTETWTKLNSVYINGSPAACFMSSDYAVEPISNRIFGCAPNASRDGFELNTYVFNPVSTNAERTQIATVSRQLGALAFDKTGQLYGIDQDGTLYKVDKNSGDMTPVGPTSVTAKADGEFISYIHSSAVIDDKSGKMYWSVTPETGSCALYEVDRATASATKLRDFDAGIEVTGLYITEPEAAPGAPSAATELDVRFESASLDGFIIFKAPGTTYAGDNMEEDLTFRVLANDVEIAKDKVYAKATKTWPISVPERGDYVFKVICANAHGEGPAAKIKATVGYPAPASPKVTANVTSTAYSSYVKVEWEAVTTTAEGDPLGDIPVSYKVVRYPDEKVIEENTTSTSVYDFTPEAGQHAYQYGVTAIALNTPSEEGYSPIVVVGLASVPYHENFTDESVMHYYTIVDANNDGKTWQFYSGDMTVEANPEQTGDDWLITPPLDLRNDRYYKFSIDVRARSSQAPGKFEVKFGTGATPEDMTQTVIEPTLVTVDNGSYSTHTGLIHVTSGNGEPRIGVHAITEPDGWWFMATNLRVSAAYESTVPNAPTDLRIVPDQSGALEAQISCTAPDKTLDGNQIASLEKIEFFRNGQLIKTIDNPTPGQATEPFTDTVDKEGEYNYTAVATNWCGAGLEAETVSFVGINMPSTPQAAIAYETEKLGVVTIEWEPVTTYIDGTPLDPDNVTYNIYTNLYGTDTKIQENLTGTSATFQIMADDEPQRFWSFGVTAQTKAGENMQAIMCDQIPVGLPYDAPFEDSFPNLSTEHSWVRGGSDSMTYWDFASDKTFEEVASQDDDNGMMAMFGSYIGSLGHLYSAKVSLDGLTKPVLTFYMFNLVDPSHPDDNTVDVYIKGSAEKDFSLIKTYTLSDFGTEGWHRAAIELDQWKGQSVQVMFIGTVKHFQYIHLDNIQIRDRFDNDVAVNGISAPERIKAGNSAAIEVAYANYGLNDARNVTIELLANGEKIDEKVIGDLPTDARGTVQFTVNHSVTSPAQIDYMAKISASSDMAAGNNETETASIITTYPNYPTVTDLRATYTEENPNSITLAWGTPDKGETFDDDVTEGFENARTWTNEGLDGWTFIDNDKYGIYGFNIFEVPEYAPQPLSQQSWWVLDDTYEPMKQHFSDPRFYKAHSGHKYLSSMAVTDNDYNQKRSDDWAISPLLNGTAQTISFWARSMLSDALESIEMLYSTSGTAIEDFTSVAVFDNVPWDWKLYYFDVPKGTKHFALRCITRDGYILMVDDVNYTPADNAGSLEIGGYNIYRDGEKLNSDPVNALTYKDETGSGRNAVYNVTAVYTNRGESMFSNDAIPALGGIDSISTANGISISTADGEIVVANAEGMTVAVYGIDGSTVHMSIGTAVDHIAVPTGAYIVVAGNQTRKVMVR